VLGAGITGLAAAHRLLEVAGDRGIEVVVLEAGERPGGKLRTSQFAGLPVDEGADAFLARVPSVVSLCERLGLADELESPATGRAYVLLQRDLHPLPAGTVMGVPTSWRSLRGSHLLSPLGILRAAAEPWWPASRRPVDEDSVGEVVRQRFGREVVTRLVDPLLGGVYAGSADRLSLAATVPQIAEARARSRSLTKALAALPAPDPSRPVFLAPRSGMQQLVDALAQAICGLGGALRIASPANGLEPLPSNRWSIHAAGGPIEADCVIVTTPAPVASTLLAPLAPDAAAALHQVAYASVAIVTLAFDEAAVGRHLDGSGYLVPRPQQRHVTACSWGSSKWRRWHRDGIAVLRASVGRTGDEHALGLDDAALVQAVLADLEPVLRLREGPVATRVSRWPDGLPQYLPGHLRRVEAMEAELTQRVPGIWVAGAAQRGLGIAACVRQGEEAAEAALSYLGQAVRA
jgi:oxygen-dependent protoporphyrinogen oxidase